MNPQSRIDSERVVIVSALLVGWAIWTAWRHLILPALVAVVGLLLVLAGWRPEPAPALVAPRELGVEVLPPAVLPVVRARLALLPLSTGLVRGAPSPDLPPAVRQQIRASLDRLSREG